MVNSYPSDDTSPASDANNNGQDTAQDEKYKELLKYKALNEELERQLRQADKELEKKKMKSSKKAIALEDEKAKKAELLQKTAEAEDKLRGIKTAMCQTIRDNLATMRAASAENGPGTPVAQPVANEATHECAPIEAKRVVIAPVVQIMTSGCFNRIPEKVKSKRTKTDSKQQKREHTKNEEKKEHKQQ